jgi:hypothetical protein
MPYILSVVPYIYFCSIKIVLEYDYFMGVWVYGCTGVLVYGCTGVWVYRCQVYGCISVWVYGCMSVWVYGFVRYFSDAAPR